MDQESQVAEALIKDILQQKSFTHLTEKEKLFLIDFYSDDMKDACRNYKGYLALPQSQKLMNIIVLVLKEYLGSWHITSDEVAQISSYLQELSSIE